MSRPILGFSSLGTFGPDSKPRILTNPVLPLASSTRLVATTIEDLSDHNISSNENKDRAKRTADEAELPDLDDFLGGFQLTYGDNEDNLLSNYIGALGSKLYLASIRLTLL